MWFMLSPEKPGSRIGDLSFPVIWTMQGSWFPIRAVTQSRETCSAERRGTLSDFLWRQQQQGENNRRHSSWGQRSKESWFQLQVPCCPGSHTRDTPHPPPPAPKGINGHYPAQPSAVGRAHVLPDDSLQARCPPGALPCSSQLEGPCTSSELSAQHAVPPGTPRPIIPSVVG